MNSKMSIAFLLGSGASVDSGMFTYRGIDGLYKDINSYEEILSFANYFKNPEVFWNHFDTLHKKISEIKSPGKTYHKIKELLDKHNGFILTQNIDKLAETCSNNCVNLHGTYDTVICTNRCGYTNTSDRYVNKTQTIFTLSCPNCLKSIIRPNFTMFGENLTISENLLHQYIKTKPKYLIVTGTTLQFPYLLNIINKMKSKGTIVIYIDPDINFLIALKNKCKRRYKNKIFVCGKSYEGLCYFENNIINKNVFGDGYIIDLSEMQL